MTHEENGNHVAHPIFIKSETDEAIHERTARIMREFTAGFELIRNYPRTVSFFGSSRFTETNEHYKHARTLAARIVKDLDYAVITGGGGGIMEAANRGALEAGGQSIGLNIRLPKEQTKNAYTTDGMEFAYFFTRKVALSFAAEGYIFFPGGYGTLDELFELLALIQTRKIRKIPIILIGKDYWEELHDFIRRNIYRNHQAIDEKDMELYTITDDDNEVVEIIKKVPVKPR